MVLLSRYVTRGSADFSAIRHATRNLEFTNGISPSVESEKQKDKKRHPTIGDNVVIGSGAQILGPIKVGNGSRIAANAVVVNHVHENATMVGVPAKAIKIGNEGNFRPYGVDDNIKDEK